MPGPKRHDEEHDRPRVRVTDKRSIRPDAPSDASAAREASARSGGSSTSEASGRSEAPPATAGAGAGGGKKRRGDGAVDADFEVVD